MVKNQVICSNICETTAFHLAAIHMRLARISWLALLVALPLLTQCWGQTVVSSTIIPYLSNNSTLRKRIFELECSSEQVAPLFLQLSRANQAATDTYKITCPPVEIVYVTNGPREVVPLATQYVHLPIIRTQRSVNYTDQLFNEADSIGRQQVAAADASANANSAQTMFSVMSAIGKVRPNSGVMWALQGFNKDLRRANPFNYYRLLSIRTAIDQWKASNDTRFNLSAFVNDSLVQFHLDRRSSGSRYQNVLQHVKQRITSYCNECDTDYHNWLLENHRNSFSLQEEELPPFSDNTLNSTFGPGILQPPPPPKWIASVTPPQLPTAPEIRSKILGAAAGFHLLRGFATAFGAQLLTKTTLQAAGKGLLSRASLVLIIPDLVELILDNFGATPIGIIAEVLQTFIEQFIDFAGGVIGFQTSAIAFATHIQTQVTDLISSVRVIARNTLRNTLSIQTLSNVTLELQNQINALDTSINGRFLTVQDAFALLANETGGAVEVILSVISQQNNQFNVFVNALLQLDRKIDATIILVGQTERSVLENRLIAKYYHESLNEALQYQNEVGIFQPMANRIGSRPLSTAEILSRENVNDAIVMAQVQLQGTVEVNSGPMTLVQAKAIDITLKCSNKFIADQVEVRRKEFLWESIGPSTEEVPSCSGVSGGANPWNCYCVLVANATTAQYFNSNPASNILFPFAFDFYSGLRMEQYPQITDSTLFPNGLVTSSAIYLDTMSEIQTYLSGPEVCTGVKWRSQRVRVNSQYTIQYVDVSMNPDNYTGGTASMCDADYRDVSGLNATNQTNLAYAIYRLMEQDFLNNFEARSTYANFLVYGEPGEVYAHSVYGNPFSNLYAAYETIFVDYVSLLVDIFNHPIQVAVYDMVQFETRYTVILEINGGTPIIHTSVNAGSTLTIPRNDSTLGNITLISNVALSTIYRSETAPPSWPFVSQPIQDPGTRWCIPLESDPTKCNMTQIVLRTDYNFDEFPPGFETRCGKKNYIATSVPWYCNDLAPGETCSLYNIPTNTSTHTGQRVTELIPSCAVNSPILNQRRIEIDTDYCGLQLNPSTGTLENALTDLDFCTMLKYFQVPTYVPPTVDGFAMKIVPRGYVFRMTLQVDDGEFAQVANTVCPTSWGSTYINGTRMATVRLGYNAGSISVRYSICKANYLNCISYGVLTSFGNGVDFTRSITGIDGEYFMQVWPWTDNAPTPSTACFNGTGFSIYINSSSTAVSGLPPSVGARVIAVMSSEMLSQAVIQDANIQFTALLLQLQLSGTDQQLIADALRRMKELRDRVANITANIDQDPELQRQLEASRARVLAAIDSVQNQTSQSISELQSVLVFLDELYNRSADGFAIIEFMKKFNNQTIDAVVQFVDQLNDIGGVPNVVTWLGDAIRQIPNPADLVKKNLFDRLLDGLGLGGALGSVVKGIMMLVGLLLGVCCCVGFIYLLVKGCKKWRDNNLSVTDAAVSDKVKEQMAALALRQTAVEDREAALDARVSALEERSGTDSYRTSDEGKTSEPIKKKKPTRGGSAKGTRDSAVELQPRNPRMYEPQLHLDDDQANLIPSKYEILDE